MCIRDRWCTFHGKIIILLLDLSCHSTELLWVMETNLSVDEMEDGVNSLYHWIIRSGFWIECNEDNESVETR